mmetsp:Transcript_9835/g.31439  ORF Transcript_9835/g.31439 Transcript_9835/m.31439 type:complete len:205 (+) Transcript_9835:500-1114(+)
MSCGSTNGANWTAYGKRAASGRSMRVGQGPNAPSSASGDGQQRGCVAGVERAAPTPMAVATAALGALRWLQAIACALIWEPILRCSARHKRSLHGSSGSSLGQLAGGKIHPRGEHWEHLALVARLRVHVASGIARRHRVEHGGGHCAAPAHPHTGIPRYDTPSRDEGHCVAFAAPGRLERRTGRVLRASDAAPGQGHRSTLVNV